MSPTGGSRHYTGPGLGEAMWHCPSCGAENHGPIPGGCVTCGAGNPMAPPPKPPEPRTAAEEDEQLGPFDRWALTHPQATLEQAYTAGYTKGVRDATHALVEQQRLATEQQAFDPKGKVNRTVVAALMIFRDQVLATEPEEIATGEWMSVDEVTQLIRQLSQQVLSHA